MNTELHLIADFYVTFDGEDTDYRNPSNFPPPPDCDEFDADWFSRSLDPDAAPECIKCSASRTTTYTFPFYVEDEVHGDDPEEIRDEWITIISKHLEKLGLVVDDIDYYGDNVDVEPIDDGTTKWDYYYNDL